MRARERRGDHKGVFVPVRVRACVSMVETVSTTTTPETVSRRVCCVCVIAANTVVNIILPCRSVRL